MPAAGCKPGRVRHAGPRVAPWPDRAPSPSAARHPPGPPHAAPSSRPPPPPPAAPARRLRSPDGGAAARAGGGGRHGPAARQRRGALERRRLGRFPLPCAPGRSRPSAVCPSRNSASPGRIGRRIAAPMRHGSGIHAIRWSCRITARCVATRARGSPVYRAVARRERAPPVLAALEGWGTAWPSSEAARKKKGRHRRPRSRVPERRPPCARLILASHRSAPPRRRHRT